ncbi:MAG: hypothetical protein HGA63_11160 [Syntrophobacteraceae bacterium]|nr:hypothetical protein [Syntrophobacteraceae bacterium]
MTVERIQDARVRRLPFQRKIGAGLTLEEFNAKAKEGILRHVGLTESIHLIASGLGWQLDKVEDILSPVVAEKKLLAGNLAIEPGKTVGVSQIGRGFKNGKEVITLVFKAAVGESNPRERILIEGTPKIDLVISDGVNGDVATCAIMANAIPVVVEALPGLRTMADVRALPCAV